MSLKNRLKISKPIVSDCGKGIWLLRRVYDEMGQNMSNAALANIEYPDLVRHRHKTSVDAGSEIIIANTFHGLDINLKAARVGVRRANGNLRSSHVEDSEVDTYIEKGIELALEAAEHKAYVLGSITWLQPMLKSDNGEIEDVDAKKSYKRMGEVMEKSGADGFALETYWSANEAALAVEVLREFDLPIMLSGVYQYRDRDSQYMTMANCNFGDFLDKLVEKDLVGDVDIFSVNCGLDTREEHCGMPYALEVVKLMNEELRERDINDKRIGVYPNAGHPVSAKLIDPANPEKKFGNMEVYAQSPRKMAKYVPELLDEGVSLFGGCCGTEPQHIEDIVKKLGD